MKKFMVIYHSPGGAEEKMESNPEEMKKIMQAWMEWKESTGGAVTDFGTPLGSGMSITPNDTKKNDSTISGYSMMEADSMDAVVEMLKKHPHLNMPGGCTIEVLESMPIPGM